MNVLCRFVQRAIGACTHKRHTAVTEAFVPYIFVHFGLFEFKQKERLILKTCFRREHLDCLSRTFCENFSLKQNYLKLPYIYEIEVNQFII